MLSLISVLLTKSITGIWCYIKIPKGFFYQQKPKSIAKICYRISPQCTKTIDECLWPQVNWVRMDCNLKKVRLTVFKFSRFRFQNALYQVIRYSFEEFSLLPSLDMLELSKVFVSQMVK